MDDLSEDGTQLEYEGHDVRRADGVDPKTADQSGELPSGRLTENGKFARAVEDDGPKALVRVYEKIRDGIWSDRGLFELASYKYKMSGGRKVFRFNMRLSDAPDDAAYQEDSSEFRRVIPSWVKQAVYKRDKGRCVICNSEDQLHFDHDLPFSKGGTGLTPQNIRILCAHHNLEKSAKIE